MPQHPTHVTPSMQKAAALLRKTGLKATLPRLTTVVVLASAKNPLSAQDIIDQTRPITDQATIYRMLKIFVRKGLIRQIDLRHNHAHYELIHDKDEHHHLICTQCGKIEDVHDCGVDDTYTAILRHTKYFAHIQQHALEFYGTCISCNKKFAPHTT